MTPTEKHHYRNVFKSDHLGSADLEDFIEQKKPLIFTIKEVKQFKGVLVNGKLTGQVVVAGKKMDANVAYFYEPIKPMVLNATNSKQIKAFAGGSSFVEDWKDIQIELYVDDNVKSVSGGTTQGIRIRPIQPAISKPKPEFKEINFEPAKKANATIEMIEAGYYLSEEMKTKYLEYASKE